MTQLTFNLHPAQLEVFTHPARFKIVAAGRRFGKSFLSAVSLLVEGLRDKNSYGYDLTSKEVFYVAPTQQQARDILWMMLRNLGKGAIESVHENTMVARLMNGRRIHLKGSDRPDSLRGVGTSFLVLDEYAFMKPEVWDLILRPTLADVRGRALFIGSVNGKNHFYDLFNAAKDDPEWAAFSFKSAQNPFLAPEELDAMRKNMSHSSARQELDSSFEGGGGAILDPTLLPVLKHEPEGEWYIAVDLAGFSDVSAMTRLSAKFRRLDEHAIACVKVGPDGWYIGDILHGRWDIREVSLRILRAAQKYRPLVVGIEGGSLKNAAMTYLTDQMRRLNVYPNIVEVTHGGKKKSERIAWALQGRLQNGRLTCADGAYLPVLRDQMADFPNPMAHDDLIDALAYVDQIAVSVYGEAHVVDTFEPLDVVTGY